MSLSSCSVGSLLVTQFTRMTPHNMLGVHGSHSPKALARCAHLPSLRVERGRKGPQHPQSLLYDTPPLILHVSYGVPHFGKNQLLGGSMSLSPLWATQVNDLHVSMTFGPPSVFQPTSTKSPKDRHLSGPKSGAPPPQLAVAQQEGGGAITYAMSHLLLSLRGRVSTPKHLHRILTP